MSTSSFSFDEVTEVRAAIPTKLNRFLESVERESKQPSQRGAQEDSHWRLCTLLAESPASDNQLLLAAQSGDDGAFSELCRRHAPALKRRILSIVRNLEDTEDALQDTLLQAHIHLGGFRGSCKFSTWITTIGTNMALMLLRRRKSHRELSFDQTDGDANWFEAREYPDSLPDPERSYSKHQVHSLVWQEVQRLPSEFRALVDQYYGKECSLKDAADALGITEGAAKSRLSRGRVRLRSRLMRRGIQSSHT